jgi:hypothetical protein
MTTIDTAPETSAGTTPEPYAWRAEVTVSDGSPDTWYTNAMRYPDRAAALAAALGKATVWTAVTRWRSVDDSTPLSQPYRPGSEDGSW